MAQAFEPRIVYARETEKNRFVLVINMENTVTKQPYYIGGIAVIGDIAVKVPPMPFIKLMMNLQINWLEYKEIDKDEFIAQDKNNMLLEHQKALHKQLDKHNRLQIELERKDDN